jgi:hypothetical protein
MNKVKNIMHRQQKPCRIFYIPTGQPSQTDNEPCSPVGVSFFRGEYAKR